ncbi:MAG: hypothetical protein HOP29_12035 [Phycisphaerales bacterium]|nr:hypothetical protein [Phycisphaerales bacterium]
MKENAGATPQLHVEGQDDLHTIVHLLERHGVGMDDGVRPIDISPQGTLSNLIRRMPAAILVATDRPVGFVLDTDTTPKKRWGQVRERIKKTGAVAPDGCPTEGFIGRVPDYPCDFGVWLMPDCKTDGGTLETLLRSLVPTKDRLWQHAESSTGDAKTALGAKFRDQHQLKASMHCWLAWQEEPGLPFGTAIKANYFNDDSPQAMAFLRWLGKLFGIKKLGNVPPATT